MKQCSLRFRLLKILIIPIIAIFAYIGWLSYDSAYHEAEEIYDAQLTHFAKILYSLTIHKPQEILINENQSDEDYERDFAYKIWLDGELILNSSNANGFGGIPKIKGFMNRVVNKNRWRFFVFKNNNIIIEVAENYTVREDLIEHILKSIFLPQLLIIPLITLIIWLGVARGMKPLNEISNLIRNRNPNKLEPISTNIEIREITPLINAINDLIQRTAKVLETEKNFSNYAAHELRTPLATIKTQLQVAMRLKDKDKARELFIKTLPATERMQHLIEQLLMFVRVQKTDDYNIKVNFSELCNNLMQDFVPRANNRHISSNINDNIYINGSLEMLGALVNNLLNNALKYTENNGEISLSLIKNKDKIELSVSDNGVGISPEDQLKIFDSFYRASDNKADGCGLGLAIIQWVANKHDGKIKVESKINEGSKFTIIF